MIIFLLVALYSYSQSSCEPPPNKDTVSINISFDDYTEQPDLRGVQKDAVTMNRFSKLITDNTNQISSKNLEIVKTKKNFLQHIEKLTKHKEYINLNYAGHGMRMEDTGGWAIALPGLPMGCGTINGYRNFALTKGKELECEQYFVRDSELSDLFKNKKVFGVIDSCQSGAIKPGANKSYFVSAQGDQLAEDSGGGELFNVVRDVLDTKGTCALDQNENGKITLAEMYNNLPVVAFGTGSFYDSDDIAAIFTKQQGVAHASAFSCDYICTRKASPRAVVVVEGGCNCKSRSARGLDMPNRIEGLKYRDDIQKRDQEHSLTGVFDWQECYTLLAAPSSCPPRDRRKIVLKGEIDLLGSNNTIVCSLGRGSVISPIYGLQSGAVKYKVIDARSTITSSEKCGQVEGYGILVSEDGTPSSTKRYYRRDNLEKSGIR